MSNHLSKIIHNLYWLFCTQTNINAILIQCIFMYDFSDYFKYFKLFKWLSTWMSEWELSNRAILFKYIDVYDPPSCWTIVPVGFNSANIFAAYGDKIYKIDHITCKEMVMDCFIDGIIKFLKLNRDWSLLQKVRKQGIIFWHEIFCKRV